jgi:hypothetical protein
MKFLLKLKSWQLFALIMIPFIIANFSPIFQPIGDLGYIIYVIWVYAIGSTMRRLLPKGVRPNILFFQIISFLQLLILITVIFIDPFKTFGDTHLFWILFYILLVIQFYPLGFAARMLESAIQETVVNRSDVVKTFIYLWFFPIGLWYIQPSVRRILER